MNWSVLFHFWLAGFGTFLLARSMGRSEPAALIASISFMLGGFFVTHTLYLGAQNAVAWLPLTLWAVIHASRKHGASAYPWWVLVSVGLWFQIVAGHAQFGTFGWLFVGLFAVWRFVVEGPRHRRDRTLAGLSVGSVGGFVFAATAAAALAAPQLMATAELASHSTREGGVVDLFAGIGSMPPQELINGVLPWFFGFDRPADVVQTYFHRGTGYWGQGENHWEMAFYLGIIPICLGLWAVFWERARFLKGIVVVSALLMLGRYTPVYELARMLPGLGFFRFPVRYVLWLVVAWSLLAALGFDGLVRAVRNSNTVTVNRYLRLLAWGGVLGALALGVLGAAISANESAIREALTSRFLETPPPPPGLEEMGGAMGMAALAPPAEDPVLVPAKVAHIVDWMRWNTSLASPAILWPVGQVFLLVGAVVALRRRKIEAYPFGIGLAVIVLVDLLAFGLDYHPRVPAAVVTAKPAIVEALASDVDDYRVSVVDRRIPTLLDGEYMSANLSLLWNHSDVIITSPLHIERNDTYLAEIGLNVPLETGQANIEKFVENKPLADALGLRYVLATTPIAHESLTPVLSGAANVWKNADALPLAHLASCATEVADFDAAVAGLKLRDIKHHAVVEHPTQTLPCHDEAVQGNVSIRERAHGKWTIETESDRTALLVVAETYYPGWSATIDGVDTPIERTNALFRGIVVPAGTHTVKLSYRPPWLGMGATLFFAGALSLVGTLLIARRRRLRQP